MAELLAGRKVKRLGCWGAVSGVLADREMQCQDAEYKGH